MDKLERGSGIRRNTLVRSQQTGITPLGQPSPAPSVLSSTQLSRTGNHCTSGYWAWADKQGRAAQKSIAPSSTWYQAVLYRQAQLRRMYSSSTSLMSLDAAQGKRKEQKPLPNCMSVFPSKVPNSTNQTTGSQMNTELGRAVVNKFFSSAARERKLEGELQLS
ncbi:LOW QUALITY PROTEIN: ciliary microtubule inner protein 5 [Ammospiza maritima maritima]